MGTIKDRNGMVLPYQKYVEAAYCHPAYLTYMQNTSCEMPGWMKHKLEDIKKRWQEYTEELYKKDLHDPDNHNGVITHLELDILKWEVKWALGNITTNKASGGDGIPVELFQILKDDAAKVLYSVCQHIWKLSSGHRTGKGQFSFQSQRKAMPKNAQTTAQLHSFHTLAK